MNTRMSSKSYKVGFTLVEIMIVVLIIGILLNIALPSFISAREASRAKACVENLKQIDSACQQYAMENKLAGTASWPSGLNVTTLSGTGGYIRKTPTCPDAGTYNLGATVSAEAYCTISDGTAHGSGGGTGGLADYNVGAKWYHGLSN